ncbi:MAG TPA: hypothetical protein VME23_04320 [Terracidiphilus sp.]|nr:hypothetical protein [Terracidiphilus sp.]
MHIQRETPTELVVVDGTLWMSMPFALGFVYMLYQTIHRAVMHTGNRWDILAPIILGLFAWASAQHTFTGTMGSYDHSASIRATYGSPRLHVPSTLRRLSSR